MPSSQLGCAPDHDSMRAVKKDNLTRHVNEMHRRKVKAVCTGCRKGFARPYVLKAHIYRAK
ncbi:hypothetical protein P692DRAFT_20838969 [Suillus brevipes Sb2]|nr:hypothetical protein P692DRAFT_20838969 [Suillus brevipes Sb2]